MPTPLIITLIVLVVLAIAMVVLYFVGNKMQEKQAVQREQINAAAQPATMFVIDKKIMPIKDAQLPKSVMEQMPKRYQRAKMPIVKAKIGPQVLNLICEEAIYDDVPQHGEVKAMLSGIYITDIKVVHKKTKKKMAEEQESSKKQKKTLRQKMISKQAEYQKQLDYEQAVKRNKDEEKKRKAEEKKKREREKKITV